MILAGEPVTGSRVLGGPCSRIGLDVLHNDDDPITH